MRSALAERILRAVDDHGVMLVHDRVLPCVTRLVIGEPIAGSWWSHPMAKSIYNALGELEDSVMTVKLVGAKDTLVAERLWADLVQAGMAPTHAQLAGLDDEASSLLRQIKTVTEPVIVDKTVRNHAKVLAARLLVAGEDVHTESGRHVKVYSSWETWGREHRVQLSGDADFARHRFAEVVAPWPASARSKRLPWVS
jgi:hypothetical protein